MKVSIYTDGAARGNPDGPGGYGVVLEYVDPKGELHVKELSGGYVRTTNNRMELMAVIRGLEALNRPCEVELYSDSQYVVNAFNQHWIEGWIKKDFPEPECPTIATRSPFSISRSIPSSARTSFSPGL